MLRRHKCAVSGMAFIAVLALGIVPATADSFDDVPADFWARKAIDHITTLHIMDGCGGTFFCPHEVVTRADMAVWLERVEHYYDDIPDFSPPPATGLFDDIPIQSCLAGWIEELKQDGITAGCDDNPPLYCPRTILSRAEMAVFLVRVEYGNGLPDLSCTGVFDDVPCPGGWAVDWIEQLAADGVTVGCSIDPPLFCPWGTVTRAQMAAFLSKVLSNRYCQQQHPKTCWTPNGPETGPDVVTITLDSNDDGHELLPE